MKFRELFRDPGNLALLAILLLSGFLNTWEIWSQGITNVFYAASVRSMLANPYSALFSSFDAAGFVTVDKPPVGLWVQLASASVFGFSGWSLVLPQALAGVGSVFLVYCISSNSFGRNAGLLSAFILAITPIFVAISRNGSPDGVLIFLLLLAVYFALKAARDQSFPFLLLSLTIVGIGFNVKMIQALIIVPAILFVYLWSARKNSPGKRLIQISVALLFLAAISLSWAVAVDMVPAGERPYIGGSGDNTVLGLIINYNGLHRLEGNNRMMGGPGGDPSTAGPMTDDTGVFPGPGAGGLPSNVTGGPPGTEFQGNADFTPQEDRPGDSPPRQPDGGAMGDTGSPGLMRLFGDGLAGQLSWLIPLALVSLLAWLSVPTIRKHTSTPRTACRKKQLVYSMALWLIPGLAYFSFTTGFWHPYYLATIAPPLAILAGTGSVVLYRLYQVPGWKAGLFILGILVSGFNGAIILVYTPAWSGYLIPFVALGTVVVVAGLVFARVTRRSGMENTRRYCAMAGIILILIAPFAYALTPLYTGNNGMIPSAGPKNALPGTESFGLDRGLPGSPANSPDSSIGTYLMSHMNGETWILAVPSANNEGSRIILETGYPVMALGGFSGSDEILTVTSLQDYITKGYVRYFLISWNNPIEPEHSGNVELFSWIAKNCNEVNASEYRDTDSLAGSGPQRINGSHKLNPDSRYPETIQESSGGPEIGNSISGMDGSGTLYDCGCYKNLTNHA